LSLTLPLKWLPSTPTRLPPSSFNSLHSAMKSAWTRRSALALRLRKSAIVWWENWKPCSSQITSKLRRHSRSKTRLLRRRLM